MAPRSRFLTLFSLLGGTWAFLTRSAVGGPAEAPGDLLGKPVLSASITSLEGEAMDPSQARGRFLLLAFTDRESRDQGAAWLKDHVPRFLGKERLALYNIIVPGGVFMAPRKSILSHVRGDVTRIENEIRDSLSPADRETFASLDIRWHVDFDRRLSGRFGVPAHQVSLVLVDPGGIVVLRETAVTREAIDRVLALVDSGR